MDIAEVKDGCDASLEQNIDRVTCYYEVNFAVVSRFRLR